MPTRRLLTVGLAIALSGCADIHVKPQPDTAAIPLWAQPIWPGDYDAILHAQWAWADPSRTHGLPTNLQWLALSPFAKMRMLQARADVRAVLGIAPDAPSQAVVNAMLSTQAALDAGDQKAALNYLREPIFTIGPEQTLALLGALPYVQTANIGTAMTAGSPLMS
jgi:hypothetical protein